MKRFLVALFCLFVVAFSSAYATDATEVPAFDKTVFEASSLYSYDKFDKTWTVQAHWEKKYSDATIEFHIVLFDSDLAVFQSPELIVEFFNKDYQAYDEVTAFRMLIGEKLYTFEKMDHFRETAGSVYGGNVLRNMLSALNSSDEVAIQIDVTDKYGTSHTYTIDPVTADSLSEVKTISQLLEKSNYWAQYPSIYMTVYDSYYSASEE